MTLLADRLKKLTLLSVAGYIFILALAAKGVSLYATQHPGKDQLLAVDGIVMKVRLGGNGSATSFEIEVDGKTSKYSSYYGKVWPGMERIEVGDRVSLLVERNKLNRNEFISGKSYYIWELIHDSRVVVAYEDVHEMVESKEKIMNQYINGILKISAVFLIIAYLRALHLRKRKEVRS